MSARKKKSMYSKCIVALVIVLNVAFACVGLWINATGYDLSPTLTTCWFAFTGTELLACAGIQITKVRHEPTYEEADTDNREGEKGPKDAEEEDIPDEEFTEGSEEEDADDSTEAK